MSIPGQHIGGYCSGCGAEYDCRAIGCETCRRRHGQRRARRTRTLWPVRAANVHMRPRKAGAW